METVIALGTVACNVARKLENCDEYDVYKIDHEESGEENYLQIGDFEDPEEYEKNPPSFKNFLKKASGDTLFIVSGASRPAGASLVILEYLHKKCKIDFKSNLIIKIKIHKGNLKKRVRLQLKK